MQVDIPVDPYLYEVLKKCGVETDVLHKSNLSYYGRVLLSLAPSIIIILYIRAFQYRAREKASEKIYDLLKMNRDHLILVSIQALDVLIYFTYTREGNLCNMKR